MGEFASSEYTAGQLNSMVKNIRKVAGRDGVERLLKSELSLGAPDTPPLLKLIGEVELSGVAKFVAADAFTKENGIAYMGENFRKFILSVVEQNISATTLTVSDLTEAAKDMRIATALEVDRKGEVALAHFFELLQRQKKPGDLGSLRTDGGTNAAYIIGVDGNTWAVYAGLNSDGWRVNVYPLGDRSRWDAGNRFLSR